MAADAKTRLRELLKRIPFGQMQREMAEASVEQMGPEQAEQVLRAFERAAKSAEKALKISEAYEEALEAQRRKKTGKPDDHGRRRHRI